MDKNKKPYTPNDIRVKSQEPAVGSSNQPKKGSFSQPPRGSVAPPKASAPVAKKPVPHAANPSKPPTSGMAGQNVRNMQNQQVLHKPPAQQKVVPAPASQQQPIATPKPIPTPVAQSDFKPEPARIETPQPAMADLPNKAEPVVAQQTAPQPEPVVVKPIAQPEVAQVKQAPPQPQQTAQQEPQAWQNQPTASGAELDKLRQENEDLKGVAQRLQADFENYKRRNKTIATDMYNEGIQDTIKNLMTVMDSFDFALANENLSEKEKEGIVLIKKQFDDALTKFAVAAVGAAGEDFDPSLHSAVMQIDAGAKSKGKIVLVLQRGYKMGDKVLRYAMVQVGA